MTTTEHSLGSRWFEEVWNQARREAIAEILAPDAVLHDGGQDLVGPAGFYPFFDRMSTAFAGIRVAVEDTFAQGDQICVRWRFGATHTGDGLGIPASGATIGITGICIFRVANDRIAEAWQNWDMLGMMQQMQNKARAATYLS